MLVSWAKNDVTMESPHIPSRMKILGIDPGIVNIGYAMFGVEEHKPIYLTSGFLTTKQYSSTEKRLKLIYNFFENILKTNTVETLVYEQPMFNRGISGANIIKAEGVLLLLAGLFNLNVYTYTATEVKKAITQSGKADKQMVDDAVCEKLGLKLNFTTDHESDSCAIALTYFLKNDTQNTLV